MSLAVGSDEDGLPYCRFEESGDLGGRVYHCEGRLEIGAAARFHNAAFVARDDAHLSGEIGRASAVDVAVLSGGDIRLEAPGIVRGWLMSAGDAELAPGTTLEGAIMHMAISRRVGRWRILWVIRYCLMRPVRNVC